VGNTLAKREIATVENKMPKVINKIIKTLIASNFFFNSGWGMLGPVFAIFIVQNIAVGDPIQGAKVAGFAAFIYWFLKSVLQIPIAHYVDKIHGEKDDFWFMVLGTFINAIVPFGYLVSFLPWHIYAFQVVEAIGMAMLVPARNAVFTRHIDRGREAVEWGMDSTFVGFGIGISGAIGGLFVAIFGFKIVFILTGVFTLVATFLLLITHRHIHPADGYFPDFFPSFPKRTEKEKTKVVTPPF